MKIDEFKLERFFAKYEFDTPYILCASDCESFTVEELLQLEDNAKNDWKKMKLGYTEYIGDTNLRQEISTLYTNIISSEVIVFSGAEEGIFAFMNCLLGKDDHIIVQVPAYQSLYEVARSLGCKITKWVMNPEKGWNLDIHFLLENITDNTKCLIINFPHNPTGSLITNHEFMAIIEIAKEHEIFVFSDEVYRFLEYEKSSRLPAACDIYDKAVSLGVMSKSFGLAGLRIGWIATRNQDLFQRLSSFKDYTTICNSALSEFFATVALKHKEYILKRNLNIVKQNLNLLDGFFRKNQDYFGWVRPKAGSVGFPLIKKEVTSDDFFIDLLDKQGVLILPSSKFDFGSRHFRIGFGRKSLPDALKRLNDYVRDILSKDFY